MSPSGSAGASPSHGGKGQQIVMMQAGPTGLDSNERRKLVKEIRDEVKPLCAQIADLQIEKANQVIKV